MYGEDLSYGLIGSINNFIRLSTPLSIFTNLEIIRDHINSRDVLYGIENLAKVDFQESALNLSTGVGTTIFEVLSVLDKLGYDLNDKVMQELPQDTKLNSILDCAKLHKLINWHPISVHDGIGKLMGVNS